MRRLMTAWIAGSMAFACAGETPEDQAAGLEIVRDEVDYVDAEDAVGLALADERLQGFLETRQLEAAEVRPAEQARGLVVTVELKEPIQDSGAYPLDVCAIDTGDEPITAIVWLIRDDRILAVTPRWGRDIACGY